jgi:hypothetical protein
MAGIGNAFENACILNAVGIVAILVNSALITHFGRRRVFLVSGLILCGIAQLVTAVVYTANPGTKSTGQAIVGLSVVYILGYNVCAPLPALIVASVADFNYYFRAWWPHTLGSRVVSCLRSVSVRTPLALLLLSVSSWLGLRPLRPRTLSTPSRSTGAPSMASSGRRPVGSLREFLMFLHGGTTS